MIARLTGIVNELKPTELIMDVQGIGYQVFIPFSTYEKIENNKEAQLYIYTLHKEDQFKLFGFISENEKQLFSTLLNISGIGPSMALSILSGIEIDFLIDAVRNNNPVILTRIPGIGKTKAEKLIFELKRKIQKLEACTSTYQKTPSVRNDAVEALASLGFDESTALDTVNEILNISGEVPLEDLVKDALKKLST